METETKTEKPKRVKKPPTERQAFQVWTAALMIVGGGLGIAISGLSAVADRFAGDEGPGAVDLLVVGALLVFVGALLLRSVPKTLKPLDRFAKDKAAVSPVIAVVLMVAITVVLAAVVFVLVSDIGNQDVDASPRIVFGKDGPDALVVLSADSTGVQWGDLRVQGCSGVLADNETVYAGDRVTGCVGEVRVIHKPSNSLIYRTEF